MQTPCAHAAHHPPAFISAMNIIADKVPLRIDRILPGQRTADSRPATGSRASTWSPIGRHAGAFGAVLALHLAAGWALHATLRVPDVEWIVPVHMVAHQIEAQVPPAQATPAPVPPRPAPPKPSPLPTVPRKPAPAPAKPQPRPAITQTPAMPSAPPAPTPLPATPEPAPLLADAPTAPVGQAMATAPAPAAQPPAAARTDPAPSAAAAAPQAPAPLELPSSDAQYLQNPKPRYPPISMRTGEQGTVLLRVLVTDQGVAKDVQLKTSSGFFRLDNAALEAVARWRFVPGKRAGVPQTMWFTVPITFGLR